MKTTKGIVAEVFGAMQSVNETIEELEGKFIRKESSERPLVNRKFTYAIDKNLGIVSKLIEELIPKQSYPKIQEYQMKWGADREKLINEHAKKDEEGKVILNEGNQADVPDEIKGILVEMDKDYGEIITDLDTTWKNILAEEVEIDFYNFDEDKLPEYLMQKDYNVLKILFKEIEG